MNQLFEISRDERNRIISLHENATKKQYLSSLITEIGNPGATNSSYSKDVSNYFSSGQYESEKVKSLIESAKLEIENFIKTNGGKQFVINIEAGESQVTNPKGFETKGSLALARANSVKRYFTEIFPELIKNGTIVFKVPTNVNQVKIGNTPYKIGANIEDSRYRKEQFVRFVISGANKSKTPQNICSWGVDRIQGQGEPSSDYVTTDELIEGKGNLNIYTGRIPDRMVIMNKKGLITQDTGYVATGPKTYPYSEFKFVPLVIANLTKVYGGKSVSGNKLVKLNAKNYSDLLKLILVNPNSTNYEEQASQNVIEVGNGLRDLKQLCDSGVKEFIVYTITSQNEVAIPFDTSRGDYRVVVYSPVGKTGYQIKGNC